MNMETLTFIFYFFLSLWYLGAIWLIIYLYRHNYIPYPVSFNERFYKELPSNLEPGELSILVHRKIEPQVLTTTFLKLIKKGALELQYKDGDYLFIMKEVNLERSEKVIYDFLANIAHNGEFTLSGFNKYCNSKRGDTEFLFQFDLWKKVLRKESSSKQFFDDKKGYSYVKAMKNLEILLLIANIAGGYHLITGYGTILPIVFIPFFFKIIYRRTKEYSEEYEKWISFSEYLEHIKEFEAPKNINSYTQSAIVLKKIDALFGYKPTDKSILFAHELNRTLLKCYRHAYLNGNRSLF